MTQCAEHHMSNSLDTHRFRHLVVLIALHSFGLMHVRLVCSAGLVVAAVAGICVRHLLGVSIALLLQWGERHGRGEGPCLVHPNRTLKAAFAVCSSLGDLFSFSDGRASKGQYLILDQEFIAFRQNNIWGGRLRSPSIGFNLYCVSR